MIQTSMRLTYEPSSEPLHIHASKVGGTATVRPSSAGCGNVNVASSPTCIVSNVNKCRQCVSNVNSCLPQMSTYVSVKSQLLHWYKSQILPLSHSICQPRLFSGRSHANFSRESVSMDRKRLGRDHLAQAAAQGRVGQGRLGQRGAEQGRVG